MHYQSQWNLCTELVLCLIHEIQTNLSHKRLINENFLRGLSKWGRYMLDFLEFWSKSAPLWRTEFFQIIISKFIMKVIL